MQTPPTIEQWLLQSVPYFVLLALWIAVLKSVRRAIVALERIADRLGELVERPRVE